jgi:hypothetical protein
VKKIIRGEKDEVRAPYFEWVYLDSLDARTPNRGLKKKMEKRRVISCNST